MIREATTTCTYCGALLASRGDRVCGSCHKKSDGRDLDQIMEEYDNTWKLSRVFDWRMLETVAEMVDKGELTEIAALLRVPAKGAVMRDLLEWGADPMAIGWVLLSYHLDLGREAEFCREELARLARWWRAAAVDTRRVFRALMEPESPAELQASKYIYFAQAEEGPILVGLSPEPHAEVRRLRSDWSPMEIDLVGLLPGDQTALRAIRLLLEPHRLDGDWYAKEGSQVVRALTEPQAA